MHPRLRRRPAPPAFCIAPIAVLGRIVAFAAASILLLEVFLLLANVLARYVFNRPLVWGDELASILFVWLCVLGAVLAMRRNEHMRLTALISRMPPQVRPVNDCRADDRLGVSRHHHLSGVRVRLRRELRAHARYGDRQHLARGRGIRRRDPARDLGGVALPAAAGERADDNCGRRRGHRHRRRALFSPSRCSCRSATTIS